MLDHQQPDQALQAIQSTLQRAFEHAQLPKLHVPKTDQQYKATPNTPFHAYPEIFFQLAGINRFLCGHEEIQLKPGEACLMPAATPHQETALGNDFSAFVIVHDNTRFLLHTMESAHGYRPWGYPLQAYPLPTGRLLADLLSQTARSYQQQSPTAPHLFRSYLGLLLDRIDAEESNSPSPYSPLVTKCMDLFYTELNSEDLTLAAAAERLKCNADSLSARFSKEVGQTAIQYLTGLRIEQARKLLRKSAMTIAEVSWACGYRDPNYFSRLFKAQVGSTPRAFRKQ
ncbi:helix-turn-helix transcriptional regulator [Coraliomargarita akajimensis]|uniref:Transcriptional regulator, AraC family n=1 Tax=Coraliomargarita akajimensis (strain DSM 45221 / IAM 15411 / JCM 23193 / KCTC 12865 / 04OKA010-24) TaxID=583355 RepID=D5EN61_CORAD|nr:helix-turn-helix domain-containing protein [Coraliomargarita akajimensis]ADE53496.1 transcriptional regulator, AraC family [Coraliomargarita akajimensis DSM 45221]